ncbi:anucleate primary sterigmata protein A [Nannizzia gypsea CBS 118893]|uniref:Anucleate primary sterigmata protein A n=1 Tax=Arthroderma gypseum (strain ATCC MYA-4604 / CBS 118893) TaxID=535722 RepID=E4USY8_ARTGP|nr:anucleate primary sterigmata protein A [Nannizzia gypsea CBS 118893]EFR00601.1 anucleate primary sterigmata protein A [Nannizzia gypsea CBS 118893]
MDDPFVATPLAVAQSQRESHRYSSFDNQLLTLNSSSPSQLKRALEIHLAETDRRLEETSRLGTALIRQQQELADKLKEVEEQEDEGEIGPELREKLLALERDYNEIGRESARTTFGAKPRLLAPEDTPLDSRTPSSPAYLSSQATNSPSKVSVPSRRQRNQPASRIHDIEFATEISTSLLTQVRQLQALLAERDEALRETNLEKSRLELEAEGFSQRIRSLDESEQRYKDENWRLETQSHELMAAAKEAAARENRLTANLNALTSKKNSVQRELDELKQANGKLIEEQSAAQKAHDSELHILRRNLNTGDAERNNLRKKVDELVGQNQELAKAVAVKLRQQESEPARNVDAESRNNDDDEDTPENSPPPSPNKVTPRHGHLESETLKSSLHHAHRMIQNLKSNIHREKSEKIELKRMLQEARDDLEARRNEIAAAQGSAQKRQRTKAEIFKKPPRPDMLGAGRRGITEIELDEPDWEDEEVMEPSPTKTVRPRQTSIVYTRPRARPRSGYVSASDAYQTANETEDGGFETAHEAETATESENFQTGAEDNAGDSSDELTETEDRAAEQVALTNAKPYKLRTAKAGDRSSFMSTASTSADEDDYPYNEVHTPVQSHPPRYRLKMQKGRNARSSEETIQAGGSMGYEAQSPGSMHSPKPRVEGGRSLFAELGEAGMGSDGEFGSPLQQTNKNPVSPDSTPIRNLRFFQNKEADQPPRVPMVDSSMMTEPWPAPAPASETVATQTLPPQTADATTSTTPAVLVDSSTQSVESKRPITQTEAMVIFNTLPSEPVKSVDMATQCSPVKPQPMVQSGLVVIHDTPPAQPSRSPAVDMATQYVPAKPQPMVQSEAMVMFDSPPVATPVEEDRSRDIVAPIPVPVPLSSSSPEPEPEPTPEPIKLELSPMLFEETTPVPAPVVEQPRRNSMHLAFSNVTFEQSRPVTPLPVPAAVPVPPFTPPKYMASSIQTIDTPPISPPTQPEIVKPSIQLEMSSIYAESTTPIVPEITEPTVAPPVIAVAAGSDDFHSVGTSPRRPRTAVHDRDTDVPLSLESSREMMPPPKFVTEDTSVTNSGPASPSFAPVSVTENGAQTILTSKQIDSLLLDKYVMPPPKTPESRMAAPTFPATPEESALATPRAKTQPSTANDNFLLPNAAAIKRPGSAGSRRSAVVHPPLPADHKQAIAAATQRLSTESPTASAMGPPAAPASAYRSGVPSSRPRTPNEQATGTAILHGSNGSKAQNKHSSAASRRSSISSFASELDDRFNLSRSEYGFEPGTDPRMIQAITQTMIGEFLWKYTRKAGRPEFSQTRHRRYFWVHPFTRTLYWSTQSPQTASKAQLMAKSVAIEAVRVVTDDNPYPPGLHRKSLEVVTPGRTMRFTAATSQRHETWFNALSYLLLRANEEEGDFVLHSTPEDGPIDFNPSLNGRSSRMTDYSRRSAASHSSRAARGVGRGYDITPGHESPSLSVRPPDSTTKAEQARQGSVSRLSSMFKTSNMMGTFSSRRSRYGGKRGSVDDTSQEDSAEDLRRILERQEREADKIENVRACCDGKHDVGSLSRTSRFVNSRLSNHSHS